MTVKKYAYDIVGRLGMYSTDSHCWFSYVEM
jgi:hypothetical protein